MAVFDKVFELNRGIKVAIVACLDVVLLMVAFFGALVARWDNVSVIYDPFHWLIFSFVVSTTLLTQIRLGLYRNMLRYMNAQVIWSIVLGCLVGLITAISVAYYLKFIIPRSVPFIFMCFAVLLMSGIRYLAYALASRMNDLAKQSVVIYGAGAAGRQLAKALESGDDYHVVGFVDDDTRKLNSIIQGKSVVHRDRLERLLFKKKVNAILLAIPSVATEQRKEILSFLEPLPVKVLTIPPIDDLISGRAGLSHFKEVEIDDLLGRAAVKPDNDLMAKNIQGKRVLVTGAGGSIGSELCRQILAIKPSLLILVEMSEYSLYEIEKELSEASLGETKIVPLLASVQNQARIESILAAYKVDTIYHAAAYKHVPMVEYNVTEGVRNNVFGTVTMAQAAIRYGVKKFVLISTDKAVRPTNVMGTTKRLAELTLQALSEIQSTTCFSMVRFGNVLGSSGSVVPLFRKQIKAGGPVTVTHKDITRYFMTIPEAAQLVIQAGAMGKGGDVFVLDMGDPVKIIDLAQKLIRFSGLEVKTDKNPNGDIAIECTGLRPGEKLYEELLIGDNVTGTEHERIMTANEIMLPWPELQRLLDTLEGACNNNDHLLIRYSLLEAPTSFSPTDEIGDLVWAEENKTLSAILKPLQQSLSEVPNESEILAELAKGPTTETQKVSA